MLVKLPEVTPPLLRTGIPYLYESLSVRWCAGLLINYFLIWEVVRCILHRKTTNHVDPDQADFSDI